MKKYSVTFGWIGTILIVGSYALLSFSFLPSSSIVYQTMNLLGALGIIVDTYYKKDRPPEVLNIIWAIIAIIAIIRIIIGS